MPNSNRGSFGRGTGTITVIEEPVLRSYRRKAKIVFYLTWVIVGVSWPPPWPPANGTRSSPCSPAWPPD